VVKIDIKKPLQGVIFIHFGGKIYSISFQRKYLACDKFMFILWALGIILYLFYLISKKKLFLYVPCMNDS